MRVFNFYLLSQVCLACCQLHINTHKKWSTFWWPILYVCLFLCMHVCKQPVSLSQNLEIVSTSLEEKFIESNLWKRIIAQNRSFYPNLNPKASQQTIVLMKTSWRRLSSSEYVFKTSWICLCHTSEKFMFNVQNLQEWQKFLRL